jgi:hypothetical protein
MAVWFQPDVDVTPRSGLFVFFELLGKRVAMPGELLDNIQVSPRENDFSPLDLLVRGVQVFGSVRVDNELLFFPPIRAFLCVREVGENTRGLCLAANFRALPWLGRPSTTHLETQKSFISRSSSYHPR